MSVQKYDPNTGAAIGKPFRPQDGDPNPHIESDSGFHFEGKSAGFIMIAIIAIIFLTGMYVGFSLGSAEKQIPDPTKVNLQANAAAEKIKTELTAKNTLLQGEIDSLSLAYRKQDLKIDSLNTSYQKSKNESIKKINRLRSAPPVELDSFWSRTE